MKANHVKREPWHNPQVKTARRRNSLFAQREKRYGAAARRNMRFGGWKDHHGTRNKYRARRGLEPSYRKVNIERQYQRSVAADYDFYIHERMVKSGRLPAPERKNEKSPAFAAPYGGHDPDFYDDHCVFKYISRRMQ